MNIWQTKSKVAVTVIIVVVTVVSTAISVFGGWDDIFVKFGLKTDVDGGSYVRFVDVGQGDCTLVQSDGRVMLIDTGDSRNAVSLYELLTDLGFYKIDTVIITHPHSDHMGGLDYISRNMTVERVYLTSVTPKDETDRKIYDGFVGQFEGEILPIEELGSFEFGVFSLSKVFYDQTAADENDRSAVIKIESDAASFLITGDISSLDSRIDTSADVLKVAHHGSKTATSSEFLKRASPKFAVISVGADNSYGHPTEEVVGRLDSAGVKIYRTDCNGTVTFDVTDGLKIITEY